MRERRRSEEKISGNGAKVKGKWPYYDIINFWTTIYGLKI